MARYGWLKCKVLLLQGAHKQMLHVFSTWCCPLPHQVPPGNANACFLQGWSIVLM